jgi:hypothetical protein
MGLGKEYVSIGFKRDGPTLMVVCGQNGCRRWHHHRNSGGGRLKRGLVGGGIRSVAVNRAMTGGCCFGGDGVANWEGRWRWQWMIRKGRMVLASLIVLVSRGSKYNDDDATISEGITTMKVGQLDIFVSVN